MVVLVIVFQKSWQSCIAGGFKNKTGIRLVSEGKSEEGMANSPRKTIRVLHVTEQIPVAEMHVAAREDLVNMAFGLSLDWLYSSE